MKSVAAFVSIALMAAVLGVNTYNSAVDAKSWGTAIPESIETARNYFHAVNPGTFMRVASPLNQLFALAALIISWRSGKRARLYFGLAFLAAVLAEVLTYIYFFPRNEILFSGAEGNAAVLTTVWSEWSRMNWIRNLILATGLACSMAAVDALYRSQLTARPVQK
ncbi:MAG TPA: DUF1772 domain-containing protein [Thermoanaerobaculia bacterium]|nr:DUF1772 domain-containing protein [Thermoanaerobaculia bacterium]